MVSVTAQVSVPLEPPAVFDELHRFDRHLPSAPAVQSVQRQGTGGVDTRYLVSLARFGTRGRVVVTVTAVEAPTTLVWAGERDIGGRWSLAASPKGTTVTVEFHVASELLDRLPLGGRLVGRGIGVLLDRAFTRELLPVVHHLTAAAGGDASAVDLVDSSVDIEEREH